MKKPEEKRPELSEADLKKVAGGVGRKKLIVRRKANIVDVELTDAELRSASGGTVKARKKA